MITISPGQRYRFSNEGYWYIFELLSKKKAKMLIASKNYPGWVALGKTWGADFKDYCGNSYHTLLKGQESPDD